MIITVTANPAVDVVYSLNGALIPYGLNRSSASALYAGGKGINVSRAVIGAGGETVACAMLGGYVGGMFREILRDEGITFLGIPTEAETRVNVCAVSLDGSAAEINAPGGPVTMAELASLTNAVTERASAGDVVILAGSLPKCTDGDPVECLTEIISLLREKGCTVILDCSGEALRRAVNGKTPPHIIKPNLDELRELLSAEFPMIPDHECDEEEILFRTAEIASERIAFRGISVLCTLGSSGSVFTSAEDPTEHIRQSSVPVSRVTNIKGAGDTFLGTFVHHYFNLKNDIKASMNKAAQAAAAHVGGNHT